MNEEQLNRLIGELEDSIEEIDLTDLDFNNIIDSDLE